MKQNGINGFVFQLGKALYEYFLIKRDNEPTSDNPNSNYVKYDQLLTDFYL